MAGAHAGVFPHGHYIHDVDTTDGRWDGRVIIEMQSRIAKKGGGPLRA
jgi:hypothetical protein